MYKIYIPMNIYFLLFLAFMISAYFILNKMKYKENMAVISNPIPISKQVNPGYARLGKKSCNNKASDLDKSPPDNYGGWTNQVFKVGSKDPSFIGCYKDNSSRTMRWAGAKGYGPRGVGVRRGRTAKLSTVKDEVNKCYNLCKNGDPNTTHVALQLYGECFCQNSAKYSLKVKKGMTDFQQSPDNGGLTNTDLNKIGVTNIPNVQWTNPPGIKGIKIIMPYGNHSGSHGYHFVIVGDKEVPSKPKISPKSFSNVRNGSWKKLVNGEFLWHDRKSGNYAYKWDGIHKYPELQGRYFYQSSCHTHKITKPHRDNVINKPLNINISGIDSIRLLFSKEKGRQLPLMTKIMIEIPIDGNTIKFPLSALNVYKENYNKLNYLYRKGKSKREGFFGYKIPVSTLNINGTYKYKDGPFQNRIFKSFGTKEIQNYYQIKSITIQNETEESVSFIDRYDSLSLEQKNILNLEKKNFLLIKDKIKELFAKAWKAMKEGNRTDLKIFGAAKKVEEEKKKAIENRIIANNIPLDMLNEDTQMYDLQIMDIVNHYGLRFGGVNRDDDNSTKGLYAYTSGPKSGNAYYNRSNYKKKEMANLSQAEKAQGKIRLNLIKMQSLDGWGHPTDRDPYLWKKKGQTKPRRLILGEGDCDRHSDCLGDLICKQNPRQPKSWGGETKDGGMIHGTFWTYEKPNKNAYKGGKDYCIIDPQHLKNKDTPTKAKYINDMVLQSKDYMLGTLMSGRDDNLMAQLEARHDASIDTLSADAHCKKFPDECDKFVGFSKNIKPEYALDYVYNTWYKIDKSLNNTDKKKLLIRYNEIKDNTKRENGLKDYYTKERTALIELIEEMRKDSFLNSIVGLNFKEEIKLNCFYNRVLDDIAKCNDYLKDNKNEIKIEKKIFYNKLRNIKKYKEDVFEYFYSLFNYLDTIKQPKTDNIYITLNEIGKATWPGGEKFIINSRHQMFMVLWFYNYMSCLHHCFKKNATGFGGSLNLKNSDKRIELSKEAWDDAIAGTDVDNIMNQIKKGIGNVDNESLEKVWLKYLNNKLKFNFIKKKNSADDYDKCLQHKSGEQLKECVRNKDTELFYIDKYITKRPPISKNEMFLHARFNNKILPTTINTTPNYGGYYTETIENGKRKVMYNWSGKDDLKHPGIDDNGDLNELDISGAKKLIIIPYGIEGLNKIWTSKTKHDEMINKAMTEIIYKNEDGIIDTCRKKSETTTVGSEPFQNKNIKLNKMENIIRFFKNKLFGKNIEGWSTASSTLLNNTTRTANLGEGTEGGPDWNFNLFSDDTTDETKYDITTGKDYLGLPLNNVSFDLHIGGTDNAGIAPLSFSPSQKNIRGFQLYNNGDNPDNFWFSITFNNTANKITNNNNTDTDIFFKAIFDTIGKLNINNNVGIIKKITSDGSEESEDSDMKWNDNDTFNLLKKLAETSENREQLDIIVEIFINNRGDSFLVLTNNKLYCATSTDGPFGKWRKYVEERGKNENGKFSFSSNGDEFDDIICTKHYNRIGLINSVIATDAAAAAISEYPKFYQNLFTPDLPATDQGLDSGSSDFKIVQKIMQNKLTSEIHATADVNLDNYIYGDRQLLILPKGFLYLVFKDVKCPGHGKKEINKLRYFRDSLLQGQTAYCKKKTQDKDCKLNYAPDMPSNLQNAPYCRIDISNSEFNDKGNEPLGDGTKWKRFGPAKSCINIGQESSDTNHIMIDEDGMTGKCVNIDPENKIYRECYLFKDGLSECNPQAKKSGDCLCKFEKNANGEYKGKPIVEDSQCLANNDEDLTLEECRDYAEMKGGNLTQKYFNKPDTSHGFIKGCQVHKSAPDSNSNKFIFVKPTKNYGPRTLRRDWSTADNDESKQWESYSKDYQKVCKTEYIREKKLAIESAVGPEQTVDLTQASRKISMPGFANAENVYLVSDTDKSIAGLNCDSKKSWDSCFLVGSTEKMNSAKSMATDAGYSEIKYDWQKTNTEGSETEAGAEGFGNMRRFLGFREGINNMNGSSGCLKNCAPVRTLNSNCDVDTKVSKSVDGIQRFFRMCPQECLGPLDPRYQDIDKGGTMKDDGTKIEYDPDVHGCRYPSQCKETCDKTAVQVKHMYDGEICDLSINKCDLIDLENNYTSYNGKIEIYHNSYKVSSFSLSKDNFGYDKYINNRDGTDPTTKRKTAIFRHIEHLKKKSDLEIVGFCFQNPELDNETWPTKNEQFKYNKTQGKVENIQNDVLHIIFYKANVIPTIKAGSEADDTITPLATEPNWKTYIHNRTWKSYWEDPNQLRSLPATDELTEREMSRMQGLDMGISNAGFKKIPEYWSVDKTKEANSSTICEWLDTKIRAGQLEDKDECGPKFKSLWDSKTLGIGKTPTKGLNFEEFEQTFHMKQNSDAGSPYTDMSNSLDTGVADVSLDDYYRRRLLTSKVENRLGGSENAYTKTYKPLNPDGTPQFFNSVWGLFH